MPTKVIRLDASPVSELYITAAPDAGPGDRQAEQMFAGVADALRSAGARIMQERVFFAPAAAEAIMPARSSAYGDLDDGVAPALLNVSEGAGSMVAGAQVHAVVGGDPEPVDLDGQLCGRLVRAGCNSYLAVSGLSSSPGGTATEQARAMLEKAEKATLVAGGNIRSVARTWMWLGDILSWYDDFNHMRNEFFRERGLTNDSSGNQLPASTGIGVAPAGGGPCAMDLVAVIGAEAGIEHLLAGGEQGSAFDYGSAFSRASRANTPAGRTVYVSGTAAIDRDGRTEFAGDGARQIDKTVAHVQAVLKDMGCAHEDVVQATVYCKTADVERIFRERWGDLPWPQLIMIADVCRDDLLFEAEVTARSRQ